MCAGQASQPVVVEYAQAAGALWAVMCRCFRSHVYKKTGGGGGGQGGDNNVVLNTPRVANGKCHLSHVPARAAPCRLPSLSAAKEPKETNDKEGLSSQDTRKRKKKMFTHPLAHARIRTKCTK